MPGLLYDARSPGSETTGVRSREIVNGSDGSRRQKSPFQPVSFSCAMRFSSASSRPEVCEASWATVMFDLRGSVAHSGMSVATRSSAWSLPSLSATARDTPPTSDLAVVPGAYHSQTMRSWRTISSALVPFAASDARRDSIRSAESPDSAGVASCHSKGAGASAARTTGESNSNERNATVREFMRRSLRMLTRFDITPMHPRRGDIPDTWAIPLSPGSARSSCDPRSAGPRGSSHRRNRRTSDRR